MNDAMAQGTSRGLPTGGPEEAGEVGVAVLPPLRQPVRGETSVRSVL